MSRSRKNRPCFEFLNGDLVLRWAEAILGFRSSPRERNDPGVIFLRIASRDALPCAGQKKGFRCRPSAFFAGAYTALLGTLAAGRGAPRRKQGVIALPSKFGPDYSRRLWMSGLRWKWRWRPRFDALPAPLGAEIFTASARIRLGLAEGGCRFAARETRGLLGVLKCRKYAAPSSGPLARLGSIFSLYRPVSIPRAKIPVWPKGHAVTCDIDGHGTC